MRLGGWARIWIVLSVVFGVLVGLIAYDSRPSIDTIYDQWFLEASEIISASVTNAEGDYVNISQVKNAYFNNSASKNVAWLEKIESTPNEAQKIFSRKIAALNSAYRQRISDFTQQQLYYWLRAVGVWLAAAGLFFIVGWAIGWVARGFRSSSA